MLLWEDFCSLEQSNLLKYILRLEVLPNNALESRLIQETLVDINPDTKNQLISRWYNHYRGIAWWLKVLIPGIYKPLSQDEFEAFSSVSENAHFSIAKLKWALKLYKVLPFANHEFGSPAELWYMMEFSDFLRWLQLAGLSGSPALNQAGRLLGKAEGLDLDIEALTAYKKNFRSVQKGSIDFEDLESPTDSSYEPTLIEILLGNSLAWLSEAKGDDSDLYMACLEFLDAKLRLQREARKKLHAETQSAFYLVSPNQIFVTQKGIKTPRPGFSQKRPRGRPPKGRNVKKY